MLAAIGHKRVKRVQRHSPDGTGLALGFLYHCLCHRTHAGCHRTGTTVKPSRWGQWQTARPAEPEVLARGEPRVRSWGENLTQGNTGKWLWLERPRRGRCADGPAQLSPLKN